MKFNNDPIWDQKLIFWFFIQINSKQRGEFRRENRKGKCSFVTEIFVKTPVFKAFKCNVGTPYEIIIQRWNLGPNTVNCNNLTVKDRTHVEYVFYGVQKISLWIGLLVGHHNEPN